MVELGLNSHHQALVLSYMKFARYLREQSIKTVERTLDDVHNTLFEDTYTIDDVKDVLTKLRHLLRCDVQTEMCSFAHNNVLMLQQLFTQAESWHLRMVIQLSELQNSELLGMIQQLEVDETLVTPAADKNTEENSEALLRMEIERLRGENEKLQSQMQECADKCEQSEEQLAELQKRFQQAAEQFKESRNVLHHEQQNIGVSNSMQVEDMEEKLKQVEQLLQVDKESSRVKQTALMTELNSTRQQIVQVESQLKLAEMELERKFSETKAYANMKQILVKKNVQLRRLRSRLQEFEAGESSAEEGDDES